MKTKIIKTLSLLIVIISMSQITNAAKMYFQPTNGDLINDCGNVVDIMIDTEGEEIMGGAANIMYDPNKIEITKFYPNEEFNVPVPLKAENGKLRTAMLSAKRNNEGLREGFEGIIKYGTLIVSNKQGVEKGSIELEFYGENDQKPASRVYLLNANNVLNTVENGEFNFIEGICPNQKVLGEDHLASDFDFNANLAKNVKDIELIEKNAVNHLTKSYTRIVYSVAGLILLVIVVLIVIVSKKKKHTKKK